MAEYYDALYLKLVDYDSETNRIEKIFARHHGKTRIRSILDVACGTGNYSFQFAERGYRTVGIDIADHMIKIAKEKTEAKPNPSFFAMDMRNIKLKETFGAATVLFGGFGYLLQKRDVLQFLSSVRKRLSRGGLLLFEFWHDTGVNPASGRKSGYLTWDRIEDGKELIVRLNKGRYSADTNVLNIEFSYYVLDLHEKKVIDHFVEDHSVKTYSIPEIGQLLNETGFSILAFYDADLNQKRIFEPAEQSTFRVMAVAARK
jgi:SAM-dependent methyltransferase